MSFVLGIDLAWQSSKNPSAIAIAKCSHHSLCIDKIDPEITNINQIIQFIENQKSLVGIAIDAPLIVKNYSGQRICEKKLGHEYGSRKVSCHSTNLTNYSNPDSVILSNKLYSLGYEHKQNNNKFQIECYPHPAIIDIFGLDERLKYKKGTVSEKQNGQLQLAHYIKQLKRSSVLPLIFEKETEAYLSSENIMSLTTGGLKRNEDALDSIICAYIAGLFYIGSQFKVFGSISDGYIVVPSIRCI